MDSRYTNRDKYLDGLSNRDIAIMITSMNDNWNNCRKLCPIKTFGCAKIGCKEKIEKWLGEYSDDE